jgi:hypothetical protein
MAVSYPDIIGDYLTSPERFGAGGIHLAGYFSPDTIALGEMAELNLFIQNNLNVPVEIQIKLALPQGGGFLQKKVDLLKVRQPLIKLKMSQAEAGLLSIPVTTTNIIKAGQWRIGVDAAITSKNRGDRVRPTSAKCLLKNDLVDAPTGLDLVSSLGATYTESSIKKAGFNLPFPVAPPNRCKAPKDCNTGMKSCGRKQICPP